MKALIVATVVKKHIMQFHIPTIKMLKDMGWTVDVAARNDYQDPADCKIPYIDNYYDIPISREPSDKDNAKAYRMLKKIIDEGDYDVVHCHTPMGGFLTRLAARDARKKGTKVFYTVHGFHFFKGAPKKNWGVYYPAEKYCSEFTDVLITICDEDYDLARKKMKAGRIVKIPGIGVNLQRFADIEAAKGVIVSACIPGNVDLLENAENAKNTENTNNTENASNTENTYKLNKVDQNTRGAVRKELLQQCDSCEPADERILLSVGELIHRKNHEAVIRALAKLDDKRIRYFIAGEGELKQYLQTLIKEFHLENQVKLLGYRNDASRLYKAADLFIQPSYQEGLPVAVMEAMASGLPVIGSDIRGNRDLLPKDMLFNPDDADNISRLITEYIYQDNREIIKRNKEVIEEYKEENVLSILKAIYEDTARTVIK